MAATKRDHFMLYKAEDLSGQQSTLLHAPKSLPADLSPTGATTTDDIFNIVMADVSGSMWCCWPHVVQGWKESMKDILTGETKIYVFSDYVLLQRFGNTLEKSDYKWGSTNVTAALRTVRRQVNKCTQKFIRVFLITDGGHQEGEPFPETEIVQMSAPLGKIVCVFILGIGNDFPVNYSLDMRSYLHNGSATIPSLFWAIEPSDIVDQVASIAAEVQAGFAVLTLNHEGYVLPGLEKTPSIHLGEWLFFPEPLEQLPQLTLTVNEGAPVTMSPGVKEINGHLLLDEVFPQWNSVLIQQHRRKLHVPRETFDLMDSLLKKIVNALKSELKDGNNVGEGSLVKLRLAKKNIKSHETKYATLLNLSKKIIDVEGKYANELELAENILKSTVSGRKYDTKLLKMRGHGEDNYAEDVAQFRQLYEAAKQAIMGLPTPSVDDCCRIMMSSTLLDLQDTDFLLMLDENKFEFLKEFTMTGIPVYAPVRDSSQINPWTIGIKHILVTPFAVLSQRAIEAYAGLDSSKVSALGVNDKDVLLQESEEKTRFNVIIPLVPTYAAAILKPLVRSNLYALLTTFCILKNPHILDHNVHIAALGCAWVKSISDHPLSARPQFVIDRLENLTATAELYMDRSGIRKYVDALINKPKQALMTESTELFGDKPLKTESLIKPMFFLGMRKSKLTMTQTENILKLMLAEFIGRCLSGYKVEDADATPFTDFFAAELTDPEKKRAWLQKHGQIAIKGFKSANGNLVERFFTLDDLRKSIKKFVAAKVVELSDHLTDDVTLAADMKKVKSLKNSGSCGDVNWSTFQSWAREMLLPEEDITAALAPNQVMVCVCEALRFRNSRERLSREPDALDKCLEYIKNMVVKENIRFLREKLQEDIENILMTEWKQAYMKLHQPVVLPITPQQVVAEAQDRGMQVTEETFSQVYRYNAQRRLLHNACQIPACPHYLVPHRNFNQHLTVERWAENFPHCLHVVSRELCDVGVTKVVEEVVSGSHTGRQGRRKPVSPTLQALQKMDSEITNVIEMYKKEKIMN